MSGEILSGGESITRHNVEIPRDKSGRVRWAVLQSEPDLLTTALETEAQRLLSEGVHLSQLSLNRAGRNSFTNAIARYYPGGLTTLKEKLGLPTVQKPHGYWTPEVIEQEALRFFQTNGKLNYGLLRRSGETKLASAITDKYPGGIRALGGKLGILPSRRPAGYWQDPTNIETEARKLLDQGIPLNYRAAKKAGLSSLSFAIYEYYSDAAEPMEKPVSQSSGSQTLSKRGGDSRQTGMRVLREKLGVEEATKPPGYWRDVQNIENEARLFLEREGKLSASLLKDRAQNSMSIAISKYYPGGMRALKEKLGTPIEQRPSGFWKDPEKIRGVARELADQGSTLTQRELRKTPGAQALSAAAGKHYPGGLRQLRIDLGIIRPTRRPNGQLHDPKTIESEIEQFIAQGNRLTHEDLLKTGQSGLSAAISAFYPDGMTGLREHFRLSTAGVRQKPNGFWSNPDNIKFEAKRLLEQGVPINHTALDQAGYSALRAAIYKYYPGRFKQLCLDLDIAPTSIEAISAQAANQDLEKLLEL